MESFDKYFCIDVPSKKKSLRRPVLKWAGGKTQLLNELLPRIPQYGGKYIEPFFGGGALFFAYRPQKAVIADSNPELINMYRQIASSVEDVIRILKSYENSETMFYSVRTQDWTLLSPVEAAARTIYLNKTCFNGLYRVNKNGNFNTPFGKYQNPAICDEDLLRFAARTLEKTKIICGDYIDVLECCAERGDFIFLDPPYIPVSEFSDFKRYTKDQFYLEDHERLAGEVDHLCQLGCFVIL